jgi:hypothetical protein
MGSGGRREYRLQPSKVGQMLDEENGTEAPHDAIRKWLEGCWFTVVETASPDQLKASIMDRLA